jgi:hypothetical protein
VSSSSISSKTGVNVCFFVCVDGARSRRERTTNQLTFGRFLGVDVVVLPAAVAVSVLATGVSSAGGPDCSARVASVFAVALRNTSIDALSLYANSSAFAFSRSRRKSRLQHVRARRQPTAATTHQLTKLVCIPDSRAETWLQHLSPIFVSRCVVSASKRTSQQIRARSTHAHCTLVCCKARNTAELVFSS